MKRKWIIALTIVAVCVAAIAIYVFLSVGGSAKRGPRPIVPPVEIAGVEYRAPNTAEGEGFIEAWDIKSQTLLWRKNVYHTLIIPFVEEDNQWVFIKSMTLGNSGRELNIMNEAGRRYVVKTTPPTKMGIVLPLGALIVCFAGAYVVFLVWRKRV